MLCCKQGAYSEVCVKGWRSIFPVVAVMGLLALPGCTDAAGPQNPVRTLPTCSNGQTLGPKGECMPVGIQGCADMFLEEDGLCHPSIDKCPAGTIPNFKEGCVPVGIQGCASIFIEDDGLCHPSMDKCPAGTIPKFKEGCVPVGIPDCAPEFLEADGLCHPRMAKCPAGTFAAPQKGCIPIDGPAGCGTGTWGNIADGPGTVYVDPTYSGADSDGSKAKPVTTIAQAMEIVYATGRIALAAGTYAEGVRITKPLTIEGRCPSMVRIEGTVSHPTSAVVVWVDGAADITLRGVEIGGAGVGILATYAPGLAVERIRVRNATHTAIVAAGAGTNLALSNSLVEGTLPKLMTNDLGYGMQLSDGAHVTLKDNAVVANHTIGIAVATGGTQVTALGNLIEGTLAQPSDQTKGSGVVIWAGARTVLAGNAIIGNRDTGVIAFDAGTDVTLSGNLVEGTLAMESDQTNGYGILAYGMAQITLATNVVVDNRTAGLVVSTTGTHMTATRNLIRGTLPRKSDGYFGIGVQVESGATAEVHENAIVNNRDIGLHAVFDAQLTASENVVEGTRPPQINSLDAAGIRVGDMAVAILSENASMRNHNFGLRIAYSAETIAAKNLIEGTLTNGFKTYGFGLAVLGSPATVYGNAILRNHAQGLTICCGSVGTASGNLIKDTLIRQDDPMDDSAGVYVTSGAQAILADNVLRENFTFGIGVKGADVDVTATGNLIERTLPHEIKKHFGNAVHVTTGARVSLLGNAIVDNRYVGILAANPGTDVTVEKNLIERTTSMESNHCHGTGVAVQEGARASLRGNAILENRASGVLAVSPGTELTATGDLIAATIPEECTGDWGEGIACQIYAQCTITSVILRENHNAGIIVFGASGAQIIGSLVENTLPGKFTVTMPQKMTYTGISDGILALGSHVDIGDTRVHGCTRAGILFDHSSGSLSGVTSVDNQFGLVLQGMPQPSYQNAGNMFEPNRKQNIVIGGDLPVPNEALPTPDPPAPP